MIYVLIVLVVVIFIIMCQKNKVGFPSGSRRNLAFGYSRYGYPYSYFGSYYQPSGYYGAWSFGDPYGYGDTFYGGKQQTYSCRKGCLSWAEDSKLDECLDTCDKHKPFYNFT